MKKIKKIFLCLICVMAMGTGCGNASSEISSSSSSSKSSSTSSSASRAAMSSASNDNEVEIKDNMIVSTSLPVVVDFYTTWCGPCKTYAPIFHEVENAYNGEVVFMSLDAEEYPELSQTYRISAVPSTVFIMPGGAVLGKVEGVLSAEELISNVNQLIAATLNE